MGFVEPYPALVVLVLLPLAWTVAALVTSSDKNVTRVAIAGAGGLVALTFYLAGRVLSAPKGHVLAQHLGVVARTGPLDLSVDLRLDPIGAVLAVAVAFIAGCATLHTAWSRRGDTRARLGHGGLLAFGAMLCVLAEGWAPFVVGLQLATLATFGLSRGLHEAPARAAFAADVAIVAAATLIFCSAMESESSPRFSVANVGGEAGATKAKLSMTAFVGAHVVAEDGAPLPGEPLTSPFRVDLDPGTYALRVEPGIAAPDVVVPAVTLVAGREHVLVPSGPTASFQVLADRESFEDPRAPLGPILLAFGAILIRLAAATARRASRTPNGALAVIPLAILALRIAPLLDATSSSIAAGAAGIAALFLGAHAAASRDAPSALLSALSSLIAMSIAAAAFGDPAGALVLAAVAPVAIAAGLAALESKTDVRWLGAACAAASGFLPLCGTSPGHVLVVAGALRGGSVGLVLASVSMLALVFSALACFRVYDAAIRSRLDQGTRGQGVVAMVLSIAALAFGSFLGAGTSAFGGDVASLAQRVAPSAAVVPRLAWTALGVSLAAAVIGVLLARRLAESIRVLDAFGTPSMLSARLARRAGRVAAFLSRAVQTMDRDVIDDIAAFAGETLTKVASFLGRAETRVAENPVSSRWHSAVQSLSLRLGLDHPRRRERLRSGMVVGMVALLGLLVLSSVIFH